MPPFFPDYESYTHKDNGMTLADMVATLNVARLRNEVIMFRSTGYWSRRWINRGHPTKPFHVKGKSSDWGPMAGFVPTKAIFSKVGSDPVACWKGELLNGEGIQGGYAARTPLIFSQEELDLQTQPDNKAGGLGRCAIVKILPNQVDGSRDVWMLAERKDTEDKNKKVPFVFVARFNYTKDLGEVARNKYAVYSLDERYGPWAESADKVSAAGHKIEKKKALQQYIIHHAEVVYVMKSAEVHEGKTTDLPLTGDYDLFAVGPHYSNYGPADKRLDMTLNDAALEKRIKKYHDALFEKWDDSKQSWALIDQIGFIEAAPHGDEDPDKGNISPRILSMLESLNYEMARLRELKKANKMNGISADAILSLDTIAAFGAKRVEGNMGVGGFGPYLIDAVFGPNVNVKAMKKKLRDDHYLFRRAHHNQEATRPFLSSEQNPEKQVKDLLSTFPLTTFQPKKFPAPYNYNVLTFEGYDDLKAYYKVCYEQGYVMPKNPVWGYPSYLRAVVDTHGGSLAEVERFFASRFPS